MKLINGSEFFIQACRTFDEVIGLDEVAELLDKMPTVETIPIEWIKHWCIKNYPTYPRIVTEELLKKTETWRMIEDWEKENEETD